MKDLDRKRVDTIIRFALKEDIWTGDLTSQSVLDAACEVDAVIVSRGSGIICGMDICERVFADVDETLKFRPMVSEGQNVEPDQEIAFVEGSAQSVLKAERTALNFMSMLSGIATRTRKLVDMVKDTGVKVCDTRKTIPLHRYLQKYAVTVGGGQNHRKGLWDMVLIKDNHIRALSMAMKGVPGEKVVEEAIVRAREKVQKNIKVEIEVETLKECEHALGKSPDVIMLDNMTPEMVSEAVSIREMAGKKGDVLYEVSGGIREDNIREYALTGVDMISVGALTSAIEPLDVSLDVIFRET